MIKLATFQLSSGALRLCLSGKCEKVGCDLRLRSGSTLDQCGVCGGDGSSCSPTVRKYSWTLAPLSTCSVTCGGGTLVMGPQCSLSSHNSSDHVHFEFCDPRKRPESYIKSCNRNTCPPR